MPTPSDVVTRPAGVVGRKGPSGATGGPVSGTGRRYRAPASVLPTGLSRAGNHSGLGPTGALPPQCVEGQGAD